jgi:hypothetical protein
VPREQTLRLAQVLGQPVEIEMAALPAWAPQKLLPPTGRVTIYPDDPGAPARP